MSLGIFWLLLLPRSTMHKENAISSCVTKKFEWIQQKTDIREIKFHWGNNERMEKRETCSGQ